MIRKSDKADLALALCLKHGIIKPALVAGLRVKRRIVKLIYVDIIGFQFAQGFQHGGPAGVIAVMLHSHLGGDERILGISRGNILHAEAAAFEYRLTGSTDFLDWKKTLASIARDFANSSKKKITPAQLEKYRDEIIELINAEENAALKEQLRKAGQ